MPYTCKRCGGSDFQRPGPPSAMMSAMAEGDPELYATYRYCLRCAEYVLTEEARSEQG